MKNICEKKKHLALFLLFYLSYNLQKNKINYKKHLEQVKKKLKKKGKVTCRLCLNKNNFRATLNLCIDHFTQTLLRYFF